MRGIRWLLVGALALALHIAVFVGLSRVMNDTGTQARGRDGLLVALAPAGSAAGNAKETRRTEARAPHPDRQAETRQEANPKPEPEPQPEPKPEPKPEPEPEPESEAQTDRESAAATSSTERAVEDLDKRESTAGDAGPGGAGGDAGSSSEGGAGGGDPGARADYLDRLRAHLGRHKEYPRRARAQRIEGTVTVGFTVHPDGRITDTQIDESSGHRILDQAAERMLERASPAPSFDDDMDQSAITLSVPVSYGLR